MSISDQLTRPRKPFNPNHGIPSVDSAFKPQAKNKPQPKALKTNDMSAMSDPSKPMTAADLKPISADAPGGMPPMPTAKATPGKPKSKVKRR